MKKSILLLLIFLNLTVCAQTIKIDQTKSENTPSDTAGANYQEEVVTGLDEYNQKQKNLQEKIAKIKLENQIKIEKYRQQSYLQALAAAQLREQQKIIGNSKTRNSKTENSKTGNSNQDYFDKQTKILSGQ